MERGSPSELYSPGYSPYSPASGSFQGYSGYSPVPANWDDGERPSEAPPPVGCGTCGPTLTRAVNAEQALVTVSNATHREVMVFRFSSFPFFLDVREFNCLPQTLSVLQLNSIFRDRILIYRLELNP